MKHFVQRMPYRILSDHSIKINVAGQMPRMNTVRLKIDQEFFLNAKVLALTASFGINGNRTLACHGPDDKGCSIGPFHLHSILR